MHRIRLPEPWERAEPGVWLRRFGWLHDLEAGEQLWLTVDVAGLTGVTLNGEPLGAATAWDISTLVQRRNELRLECDALSGEVALEVRRTD